MDDPKAGNLVPQSQESTPPLGGSTSEAAKFKLWVKSKGFHLGPPPGHIDRGLAHTIDTLYLPTGTDKVGDRYYFYSFNLCFRDFVYA